MPWELGGRGRGAVTGGQRDRCRDLCIERRGEYGVRKEGKLLLNEIRTGAVCVVGADSGMGVFGDGYR